MVLLPLGEGWEGGYPSPPFDRRAITPTLTPHEGLEHPRSFAMSKQIQDAYIVAATRTPIGRSHRGYFKNTRPDDLLAHALREVLKQAPGLDPAAIEDVIAGCAMPPPAGSGSSQAGGNPQAPRPLQRCDTNGAQWAVGKTNTEHNVNEARKRAGAYMVRVLRPGQPGDREDP